MSKRAGMLLGAAGALLVLLVVILLWSLGAPPQREARRQRGARARRQAPATARPPLTPPARSTAPARAIRPAVLPPASSASASASASAAAPDAATTGGAEAPGPAAPPPVAAPGTHMAPAAIPVEITDETDPARKAQLMRMHELAVARSRASRLRRRARLLRNTLAGARQQGSWGAERIQSAERDLTELGGAIKLAEKNAKLAAQRAGIKE